jgi:hypothetical protein
MDGDLDFISTDMSELGKEWIRVSLLQGPRGTGICEVGCLIEVPRGMGHILKQRFEVQAMESMKR